MFVLQGMSFVTGVRTRLCALSFRLLMSVLVGSKKRKPEASNSGRLERTANKRLIQFNVDGYKKAIDLLGAVLALLIEVVVQPLSF